MSEGPTSIAGGYSHDIDPTVWICSYLPRERGAGVERFVLLLSEAIEKAGLKANVVDLSTVLPSNSPLRRLRYIVAWRIGRYVNLHAKPKDVVICNNFFSWNARKKRSLVVYHGTDRGRAVKNRKNMTVSRRVAVRFVGAYLEKRTGRGRVIVTVSETAKEEVELYYGLKVTKVIPNAVDINVFRPASDKSELRKRLGLPLDKFLILFVGTSDRRKGLDWILDEVKPRMKAEWHLVVRSDLKESPSDVTVVQRLAVDQLAELYRSCDVLIFPTSYEGCSIVLVEALASGLPVITSPAGNGRDLQEVDALRPYILEGNDVQKYIDRIDRLARSPSEWSAVSKTARDYAEGNYRLQDFERAYLEVIDQLINDESKQ